MDRNIIIEKIGLSLTEVLNRDVSGSSEDTRLVEDLQMDSTSVLELLMALEDNLGFEVDPESLKMDDFKTIGTLANYLEAACGAAVR
jgi:acyl carrier protein